MPLSSTQGKVLQYGLTVADSEREKESRIVSDVAWGKEEVGVPLLLGAENSAGLDPSHTRKISLRDVSWFLWLGTESYSLLVLPHNTNFERKKKCLFRCPVV